jgi:hypothetical protein
MSANSGEFTPREIYTQLIHQNEQHTAERLAALLESHRSVDIVDGTLAPLVALDSQRNWNNETARLQEEAGQVLNHAQII